MICRTLAGAAGIRGSDQFYAWLSVPGINAIDRLTYNGPWMRLDGVRIATSKADLTDGTLRSSIHLDESATYLGNAGVWTGTLASGLASASSCAGWTSNSAAAIGVRGYSDGVDARWSSESDGGCDGGARLYCLQDLPLLFFDGFDSGTTLAWTTAP